MQIAPCVLEGEFARLEPLAWTHYRALCEIGFDESLWRWTNVQVRDATEMSAYIQAALDQQVRGWALPFVTIGRQTGRVVGSTRYMDIDPANRTLEIGSTWLTPPAQRTAINTEAKFLMLRHAFESLGCIRVQLKTDALNEQSRNAILRIGAKQEGTLRNHMIVYSGRVRDSVYFSVIDREWPEVKSALARRLGRSLEEQ